MTPNSRPGLQSTRPALDCARQRKLGLDVGIAITEEKGVVRHLKNTQICYITESLVYKYKIACDVITRGGRGGGGGGRFAAPAPLRNGR